MNTLEEYTDVVVVGAGHAGCEAALACARLGLSTTIFTVSVDSIALMPCNPNIGGSSKGHLVREIDALGGEMGKNIDKTFIQSKMLNKSKGPAVHSLRAQADKAEYSRSMRKVLENTDNLSIVQAEVTEILTEDGKIIGVKTFSGATYHCKVCVLCTGTYLRARCIYGDVSNYTGPNGLQAANHLTDSLKAHGIEMQRFKTGTPARVDRRSIDFSKMQEQFGDERVVPFSFTTDPESVQIDQASCWLTYTNEETHEIIRKNLDRSPLYSGMIEGTGPRYCPSIEDKVVKFADKNRHQVFLEPEGLHTNEMYIGGHPMAAGLSLDKENVEKFKRRLNDQCTLSEEELTEKVVIDMELPFAAITEHFIEELEYMEPFGKGNTKPVFAARGVFMQHVKIIGKNKNVAKATAIDAAGNRMEAICFHDAQEFAKQCERNNGKMSITFYPGINEFRGERQIQIVITHYR